MTNEQKRIAIAEACGARPHTLEGTQRWFVPTSIFPFLVSELPDYLTDLNAMHEAENTLSDTQCQRYIDHLAEITDAVKEYSGVPVTTHWCLYHATAAQRADAFIATLNLIA